MTLREALEVLAREHIGDFIYTIRERVLEDTPAGQSTWDHPRVKAWSDACVTIDAWLKENPA